MFLAYVFLAKIIVIAFVLGKQGYGPGEQDWGYINIFGGAHMFYWLFYTVADVKHYTDRPLVLWLQGGPSATGSGHANFLYLGPLHLDGSKRKYAWAKYVNVLFIDNPLGTGFSYVDDLKYISHNNTVIAHNLVKTMKGFYEKHKEFLNVPLYIFCESYGCKMGVEFAVEMWKARKNDNGTTFGKLISFNMGNPWISVEDQFIWMPKVAYAMGSADEAQKKSIENDLGYCLELMSQGLWSDATIHAYELTKKFCKESFGISIFNVIKPVTKDAVEQCDVVLDDTEQKLLLLMNTKVKQALQIPHHVTWGSQRIDVVKGLVADFLKPAVRYVNQLLNETDIGFGLLTGNLDLMCSTASTLSWVNKMNWPGKSELVNAPRSPYYVDSVLQGFNKIGGGMNLIWILRAGHLFIEDNPSTIAFILRNTTGTLD